MRLLSIRVRNFRALEEIDVDFTNQVNVVVGPNAVGKTTLLEAIRLVKASVAARTPNESNQVLISLGAMAGYNPHRVIPSALARDPSRPVEIRCRYQLDTQEIDILKNSIPQIVTDFAIRSSGLAINSGANISFLSSPQGLALLQHFDKAVPGFIESLQNGKHDCRLELEFDPLAGRITTKDPISGMLFGFLDSRLRPNQTIFSYFPADRAMPMGEQPVQLGGPDSAQQMESHASQPQLKYSRMKNIIFSAVVTSPEGRAAIEEEFARIFSGVLKGRKLVSVGVNDFGLLSIAVQDVETGRIFDLDGMSSGEKGLVLTCFLIGRSVADGGLILLDEPELT